MDIHTKTGQILNRGSGSAQQVSGPAGGGGVGYDYTATLQEIKESLNLVRRDLTTTAQRVANAPQVQCPQVSGSGNCASTMVLVGLMFVQLVILIGYLMYRDGKEAQAKKFY